MIKHTPLAFLLLLSACGPTFEYGPEQREEAVVEQAFFSPRRHGSDINVGFSTSGNAVFTPTSVTLPEVHTVVFRCQHGKFTLNNKQAWEAVTEGDTVTVVYRDVLCCVDWSCNTREWCDYDFLRVVKP